MVVSATVGPSISFSISDNTIGFGALSFASARYATGDTTGNGSETEAHQLAASTNATSGYVIYMLGNTLTSGANSITRIAGGSGSAPSSAGTEQFGVRFEESGAGTGTVTSPYGTANQFAFESDGTTQDQIASASGATDTSTYSARYIGNIDINTEAGAYSTTLTYTATATF